MPKKTNTIPQPSVRGGQWPSAARTARAAVTKLGKRADKAKADKAKADKAKADKAKADKAKADKAKAT